MKRDICFFLPTRKGSQRVKNKNTRPFSDVKGGILELKLRQLLKSKVLARIVLSTNDEQSMEIARVIDPGQTLIHVIERPNELCLDTTKLTDLIKYVPTIIHEENIIWGHTTTPFISAEDYDEGIEIYFSKRTEGYDSLISVLPFQNFLLDGDAQIYNYDAASNRWPRTQDLPVLYEINHAMFIAPRTVYETQQNRVGERPYLHCQDKIKSFDIDWEDDFMIAESIYEKLIKL